MSYLIHHAVKTPDIAAPFEEWSECETMRINRVAPGNWTYRPETELRLQYDAAGIYGIFQVHDNAIRCVVKKFQDSVCSDSCVEIFLQPMHGVGYSNFEINASGVLLTMHIEDERRAPGGFRRWRYLSAEEAAGIKIFHTLPDYIPDEITTPTAYRVGFFLPFQLFSAIFGAPVPVRGTVWRGNAFKCGDETSKPHYLSWQPLKQLNFHTPEYFGELVFG